MVVVAGTPMMNIYQPLMCLTLDGEEDMRRSIKPQSGADGWSAGSSAKQLFRFAFDEMKKEVLDNSLVRY
jgi:hypothetical protein